jgi:hypothetical protein
LEERVWTPDERITRDAENIYELHYAGGFIV